jgi:anti-sigma factor RsiW
MSCSTSNTEIMQYADAELAPERAAAVEAHLQSCTECALRLAQAMQLKRAVRIAGDRYQPSAELRSRIRTQTAPGRPTLAAFARVGSWVPALALAALVLIASAVAIRVITARAESRQLMADVVDRHVSALASANPVEVVSTDRHTVKPWFQGKLPFTFNLPELAGSPYVLEGGRLTFLNQSPGAQLIYDLRKHHISVFIFQERDVHVSLSTAPTSSFTTATWTQNGLRYFVVSDASNEDVQGLVNLLKTLPKV